MKNRIKKWIKYFFVKYIPSTKNIVSLESKRLASYIIDNYDYNNYLTLLDNIKEELIEHLKNEEIKKLEDITINNKELKIIGNISDTLNEIKII